MSLFQLAGDDEDSASIKVAEVEAPKGNIATCCLDHSKKSSCPMYKSRPHLELSMYKYVPTYMLAHPWQQSDHFFHGPKPQ